MSSKLKLYIGRKIIDSLTKATSFTPTELLPWIQIGKDSSENHIALAIPLEVLEQNLGIANINHILKIQPDDIIKRISFANNRANRKLTFEIDRSIFIRDVFENCGKPDVNVKPKTIVFEFSSPNVAKPFHLGHLRSTMIGDWGTQFGFIKIGVEELKHTPETIKKNPLKVFYESYVYANKLAESDPSISDRAKAEFSKLESGSVDYLEHWKEYMQYTKIDLESTYNRLGVVFDEYNYESMYNAKDIHNIVDLLLKKNIIYKESDGQHVSYIGNKKVSVVKSDGSTLYLTRDIAAAMDRYTRFKFDKMYYVVDNTQSEHFKALKDILYRMDLPWANRLHHIKFGRIIGQSTRRGNSVFLNDILNECRDLMMEKQIKSPTTKVAINSNETSDILGVSCVIINDLKQRRQKDYEFSWDKVLQVNGDTAIKLQYTHCRLHSLEENCGVTVPTVCVPEMLKEPQATNLITEIAKFQDVLYQAEAQFEACLLVTYLFQLCNYINQAMKVLRVKGTDNDVASQRLLLFVTAREVLYSGMRILGLQPLRKM